MTDFSTSGLSQETLKAIEDLGYVKPTPVQERVIPLLMNSSEIKDIVCLAQTGTGKTAAFGLPSIEHIDKNDPQTQILILAPTRELAKQIDSDLKNYAKYKYGITIVPVYGGASIETQIRQLKKGAQIIVATPGRIIDLMKRRVADISNIKALVLDEADEMLDMGFKDEIDTIFSSVPENRRTMLFSATMPDEIEKIIKNYMDSPEIITIGTRNSASKNVKHYYVETSSKNRYAALKRLVDYNPDIYGIIFCRTRQETQDVADALIKDGYNADSLHGELSQAQREIVMKRFKHKSLRLLVATDVAARGIDVNGLSHVINYNLPDDPEQYTHRSGRTGRADKTGISYVIITEKERSRIRRIEKSANIQFEKTRIPDGKDVCLRRIIHFSDYLAEMETSQNIAEFIPVITERLSWISKEELIEKVFTLKFNRIIEYYKTAPDLNVVSEKKKKKEKEAKKADKPEKNTQRPDESGFIHVKIDNIGDRQSVTARHILRLASACGIGKKNIGKIDIRKSHVIVAVSKNSAKFLVAELDGAVYKNRKITASVID